MSRAQKVFEYAIDIFFLMILAVLIILLIMTGFDELWKGLHHL